MYIFICTYICLYTYVYMYIYPILECASRLDLRCTGLLEKFRVAPDYVIILIRYLRMILWPIRSGFAMVCHFVRA